MAKPATLQIKLISSADTGFFYVTKKNPRTKPEKLELMKYDPKVRKHVLFKESFCVKDFEKEYNSYGGNAYGLANTLMQTAFLRPNLRSNKVKNLYFSGQLTVPGPGVPPAIVSGKLVSDLILKDEKVIWSGFWELL